MEYERRNPRDITFEYMLPSSCWTQNTDSHCLLIDLPGFKIEEVRIRADSYGHIIVSGERQANDDKIIHFEQSFKVPENCNIEETSAVLEDQVFCVTVPKNVTPEKEMRRPQTTISGLEKDGSKTTMEMIPMTTNKAMKKHPEKESCPGGVYWRKYRRI